MDITAPYQMLACHARIDEQFTEDMQLTTIDLLEKAVRRTKPDASLLANVFDDGDIVVFTEELDAEAAT